MRRLASLFALATLAWGCGSSSAAEGGKTFDGGAGGASGGLFDAASGDGNFTGCASERVVAARAPADLYVMLDYSESMGLPAGAADRWTAVTSALRSFVASPDSAGLGIGIQYFGLFPPLAQGYGSSCDPRDYASPDVEIAALPGVAPAFIASLDGHAFPRTATPMAPALAGAILHAHDWAVAHPSHSVAVLLATDGEPTECSPQGVGEIASTIVAPGVAGSPRVFTFVVGVGNLSALDALAAAGGTGHAYLATGDQVEAALLAAFDAIRKASIPCAFELPTAASGELDPDLVNVTYTKSGASAAETLAEYASAKACAAHEGWRYDDPAHPARIELCPATCARIGADPKGRVDVVLGCRSVIAGPH